MSSDKNKYYEPLKLMMPVRHQYIKKAITNKGEKDYSSFFKNKKILDIGTGTGEFLEAFKDYKAKCTGIDLIDNFKVKNSKNFKLIKTDVFKFLKKDIKDQYDIMFCFEVIEHIKNKKLFFKLIKKKIKKNGILFISTINRNIVSRLMIIDLAENILNILPKNTHDYKEFLKTDELMILCKNNNLKIIDISGLAYNPLLKTFSINRFSTVNYFSVIEN